MALSFKHMDFEVAFQSYLALIEGGDRFIRAYTLADCFNIHGWNKKEGRYIANILEGLYYEIGGYNLDYVMDKPYLIEKVYKDILYLATYCSKISPDCLSVPIVKACKDYEDKLK